MRVSGSSRLPVPPARITPFIASASRHSSFRGSAAPAERSMIADPSHAGPMDSPRYAVSAMRGEYSLGEMNRPAGTIAVLVPCHNEERSVARVVHDFRAVLPSADIYVFDNCSSDETAQRAREAGAIVRSEARRGKGSVVRRMFADVDADVYVLVDGDATYDAGAAPGMVKLLLDQELDMVVGKREVLEGHDEAYPPGHRFGNGLFNRMLRVLFGSNFTDVFSGYRVMTRRFVK